MASEKMTALILSGPVERLDDAIRRFVIDQPFHPEEAVSFLSQMRRLRRFDDEDPYTPVLTRMDAVLTKLGIAPAYEAFDEGSMTLEGSSALIDEVSGRLAAMDEEEQSLTQTAERQQTDPRLKCLKSVPESLKDLHELRYVHSRVGRVPERKWAELCKDLSGRTDTLLVQTLCEDGWVYLLALALPEAADRLDAELVCADFERFRPEEGDTPDCTAAELLAQAQDKIERGKQRREALAREREALCQNRRAELLRCRSWLKYQSVCAKTRSYAGYSFGRFYMAGWVPADDAAVFAAAFEAEPGFSCVLEKPEEVQKSRPPIRMKDGGVRALMTPLVKMYGLPAYGTVDPRLFMAVTYTIFFGMMFGDAGQGAVLALLGFALYKKTKAWLWRVIGVCGCSSVVFGLIYGSVFGLEDLLPWGGFHPLTSENIMPLLLAGAALGVVVILCCMALNIVNSLRQGDLKGALFSPNGAAGAVLYTAVIAAIVCAYTGAANLLVGWYICLLIVLPVALIWFGDPLSKLLQGRKDWKPDGWGMFFVEGFFDIFESAISYMSNTMSFLRLGAFAISHAGMMMVVSMLAEGSVGKNIIVMVIGNIFVAGLEAALSSIQIIRLEFYEIFGRFYVSGGRQFAPVTVSYTD